MLDPFAPARRLSLDPFRKVADKLADATKVADNAPAAPAPAAAPAAHSCQRDEDCTGENICESNVCQPIQLRTNVLYLYYREGAFTEFLVLYWSRRGSTGYRVVAPLYWHYWSPTTDSLVFAPFYWRFEDRAQRSLVTWYGPVVSGHYGDQRSFGIMPFFYASSRFGWALPFLGTLAIHDPQTNSAYGAAAFLYWWWRSPTRSTDLGFPLFFSTRTATGAFTYALPLNFYWRHQDDKSLLSLPLFYWNSHNTGSWFATWLGYAHREGSEYGRSLAWLYWWGGYEKTQSSYHVLFPLFWDFEEKHGGDTVVFPLLWSFRSETSNVTVVVPFVHVRQGSSYFNTLPPLWWSAGDDKTRRAHRMLVPFFYWDRAGGAMARLISPPARSSWLR